VEGVGATLVDEDAKNLALPREIPARRSSLHLSYFSLSFKAGTAAEVVVEVVVEVVAEVAAGIVVKVVVGITPGKAGPLILVCALVGGGEGLGSTRVAAGRGSPGLVEGTGTRDRGRRSQGPVYGTGTDASARRLASSMAPVERGVRSFLVTVARGLGTGVEAATEGAEDADEDPEELEGRSVTVKGDKSSGRTRTSHFCVALAIFSFHS